MTPPRRRYRYRGVPVPEWLYLTIGALLVVPLLLALAEWVLDLIR